MSFRKYRKLPTEIEMRPYVPGDELIYPLSVSAADRQRPTLVGGMVARAPGNHHDMWYVDADFFAKHYQTEPIS